MRYGQFWSTEPMGNVLNRRQRRESTCNDTKEDRRGFSGLWRFSDIGNCL